MRKGRHVLVVSALFFTVAVQQYHTMYVYGVSSIYPWIIVHLCLFMIMALWWKIEVVA